MSAQKADIKTVDDFDLSRYMGLWYEIARYDSRFEPHDMVKVTAEYSLKDNGGVKVVNSGYRGGKLKVANGNARIRKGCGKGKLEVSFFLWFYGDYNILVLDKHNYNYVLVGSSTKDYLWILARTPQLSQTDLEMILTKARELGYNTDALHFVSQD